MEGYPVLLLLWCITLPNAQTVQCVGMLQSPPCLRARASEDVGSYSATYTSLSCTIICYSSQAKQVRAAIITRWFLAPQLVPYGNPNLI